MNRGIPTKQGSKHENIALEHITTLGVDKILIESLKLLTKQEAIPANPYAILYRNIAFAKLKQLLQLLALINRKEVIEELRWFTENYYPKSHPQCPTLDFIDMASYNRLKNSMADLLRPESKTVEGAALSTYDSLGGGTIFSKKCIKATDSSPSPVTIFRTVTIEGCSLDNAIAIYANYIFDDINASTNSEDGLNIFQELEVGLLSEVNGKKVTKKKKSTIEEITENKVAFIETIKAATKNKQHIRLKMVARIPNPDSEFEGVLHVESPGDRAEDSAYVFINYTKYYGLHHIMKSGSSPTKTSLWHIPCIAYLEGSFVEKENYASYMSFYPEYTNSSVPKPKEYLEYKCHKIVRAQEKGNIIKTIWNLLSLLLLEPDATRKQFLPSIFHALSHPATQFYGLTRINQSLKFLILAYQSTRIDSFKQSAEIIFREYKDAIRMLCAKGFAAEVICFRPYIETVLMTLSANKHKELELSSQTLELLDILSATTMCVGTSIITELCKMNQTLTDVAVYILTKMGKQGVGSEIVTISSLLEKKRPQYVINLLGEIAKNARTKTFPAGKEEEYILMQYFVDTDVYENIVSMLREMMFGPSYPNLLAILEYRLQTLTSKYSVWELADEDIVRENFRKPTANSRPPQQMFLINTSDLRNKGLPICMGYRHILTVASAFDVASFRKSFARFELPKSYIHGDPDFSIRAIFSVSGTSIFNAAHRTKAFGNSWDIAYDLVLSGTSSDSARERFAELQIQYSKFLATVTVVSGIFSSEDNVYSIVSVADLLDPEREVKNRDVLLAAHSEKYPQLILVTSFSHRTYIKMYMRYENTFLQVNIYCNLHFFSTLSSNMTSLVPITHSYDLVKVFFTSVCFFIGAGGNIGRFCRVGPNTAFKQGG
eukprot:TRINITY_DN938_c0_g1_i1.p1 TRINITY_DN938_c0_g1~~TRINITY_DN938_c0_g1_i1.p1  ORF type:complete len:888 (+),score=63.56 TRINITY_DN938_c0_g1_i1:1340-4003(+)